MFGLVGATAPSASAPRAGVQQIDASATIAARPAAPARLRLPPPAPLTPRVITNSPAVPNVHPRTARVQPADRPNKKARHRFRRGPYVSRDDGLIDLSRPTCQAGFDNSELAL